MTARYALGAAVWTRDVARAHRVARDVNAGVTLQRTGMQCDAMSCHAPHVARDVNAGVMLQRTGMQCDAMSCHAPRVARDVNAGVTRINARARHHHRNDGSLRAWNGL